MPLSTTPRYHPRVQVYDLEHLWILTCNVCIVRCMLATNTNISIDKIAAVASCMTLFSNCLTRSPEWYTWTRSYLAQTFKMTSTRHNSEHHIMQFTDFHVRLLPTGTHKKSNITAQLYNQSIALVGQLQNVVWTAFYHQKSWLITKTCNAD